MVSKIILITLVALLILAIIAILFAKEYRQKYLDTSHRYEGLRNQYDALEMNYNNLVHLWQEKQRVHNETEKTLSDIANGSVDDSIKRLQNRKSRNKNSSGGSEVSQNT